VGITRAVAMLWKLWPFWLNTFSDCTPLCLCSVYYSAPNKENITDMSIGG
jgi:hypothetical protein